MMDIRRAAALLLALVMIAALTVGLSLIHIFRSETNSHPGGGAPSPAGGAAPACGAIPPPGAESGGGTSPSAAGALGAGRCV